MISPQEGFVAVWQGVSSVAGVGNMKILNMKNPSGILFDPEKAPQFPIRDGALFTGTYRDPDKLYQPMIEAFKRAIASYRVVNSG